MKAKNYTVRTDMVALSKVSDLFNDLAMEEIPVIDFKNKKSESLVAILELTLSKDPKKFNTFLQDVTDTKDDFLKMDLKEIHKICVNFFDSLPKVFLNTLRISIVEQKKQRDSDMKKTRQSMENALMKNLPNLLQGELATLSEDISSLFKKEESIPEISD